MIYIHLHQSIIESHCHELGRSGGAGDVGGDGGDAMI